ncbi:hypothetical protein C357_08176 [Citreicella sp. 357]|nr:hypothetical protein C357_08176 [Citreicella sp. 357]
MIVDADPNGEVVPTIKVFDLNFQGDAVDDLFDGSVGDGADAPLGSTGSEAGGRCGQRLPVSGAGAGKLVGVTGSLGWPCRQGAR